jgi:hypothetical protein
MFPQAKLRISRKKTLPTTMADFQYMVQADLLNILTFIKKNNHTLAWSKMGLVLDALH